MIPWILRGAVGHHHNIRKIVHTEEITGKRRETRLSETPIDRRGYSKRNRVAISCVVRGFPGFRLQLGGAFGRRHNNR